MIYGQDPGVRLIGRLEEKHSRLGWIPANSNFNTMYVYDPKNDLTFTYQNNKLIRESEGFDRYYTLGDEQEAMAGALKDDKSGTVLSTAHKDYMAVNYGGKIYIYNSNNESVFDSYDAFGIEEKNEEDCYWWQPEVELPVEKGKQYRYTILVQKQQEMLVAYDRMLDDLEKSLDETKNRKKAVITGTVDAFKNAGGDGNGVIETDDSYNYANMMQQLNDEVEAAYGEDNTVVSTYKFHNVVAESGFEKVLYQVEFEVGEFDNFNSMCVTYDLGKDIMTKDVDISSLCDSYGVGILQGYSYNTSIWMPSDQYYIIYKADQKLNENWTNTLNYDPYGSLIYLTDWALPGGLKSTEESDIDDWSKLGGATIDYPVNSVLAPFRANDSYTGSLVPNNATTLTGAWALLDGGNVSMNDHVSLIKPKMKYGNGYFFEYGYADDPGADLGSDGIQLKNARTYGKTMHGILDEYRKEFSNDAEFAAWVWIKIQTTFNSINTLYEGVYAKTKSRKDALDAFKAYYDLCKNSDLEIELNDRKFTVPYKTLLAAYAIGHTVMGKDYALWDEFEPDAQKSQDDYSYLYYSSEKQSWMRTRTYVPVHYNWDDWMGGSSPRRALKYAAACNSLLSGWAFKTDKFKEGFTSMTLGFYHFNGYRTKHDNKKTDLSGFCVRGDAKGNGNSYIIKVENPFK